MFKETCKLTIPKEKAILRSSKGQMLPQGQKRY